MDENGDKYFADRLEAEDLRIKYNKSKGNINIDKMNYTFKEVFEDFKYKYMPTKQEREIEKETHKKSKGKLGLSVYNGLMSAYSKCKKLNDKPYRTLKKDDFMDIFKNTEGGASTMSNLRNLFNKLDSYALEHDIIIKGYADLIELDNTYYNTKSQESTPYTYEEINKLWENEGNIFVDITLFNLHTGMRIEEALFSQNININFDLWYLIGGLKTESGKNRIIPIHSQIQHIVNRYYDSDNQFLFAINGKKISYQRFINGFNEICEQLGIQHHHTHDARKAFRSEFDRIPANQINKTCVDKLMGHKNGDIGKDRYTIKGIEELRETIEKINYKTKKNCKITYLKLSS
jgi:integrase